MASLLRAAAADVRSPRSPARVEAAQALAVGGGPGSSPPLFLHPARLSSASPLHIARLSRPTENRQGPSLLAACGSMLDVPWRPHGPPRAREFVAAGLSLHVVPSLACSIFSPSNPTLTPAKRRTTTAHLRLPANTHTCLANTTARTTTSSRTKRCEPSPSIVSLQATRGRTGEQPAQSSAAAVDPKPHADPRLRVRLPGA